MQLLNIRSLPVCSVRKVISNVEILQNSPLLMRIRTGSLLEDAKTPVTVYGILSTSHQGIFPVSLPWITLQALHQQEPPVLKLPRDSHPLSIHKAFTRLTTLSICGCSVGVGSDRVAAL